MFGFDGVVFLLSDHDVDAFHAPSLANPKGVVPSLILGPKVHPRDFIIGRPGTRLDPIVVRFAYPKRSIGLGQFAFKSFTLWEGMLAGCQ